MARSSASRPAAGPSDLAAFKHESAVNIANRITDDISDVAAKVYSRDLFGED